MSPVSQEEPDVRADVLLCTSGSAATPDIIGALQEFGAGGERDRDFACGTGERKVRPLSIREGGDRGNHPYRSATKRVILQLKLRNLVCGWKTTSMPEMPALG